MNEEAVTVPGQALVKDACVCVSLSSESLFQYFRMELLHCEKLKKQQMELEKAKMDLVSAS